ncbi:MAG TPA: thioredoxin domain-containing protein [bacterium]|jgi:thioredoxin-like negative regulator of GroEL|nr:thioredoxin domain-containing protein [bacterium]
MTKLQVFTMEDWKNEVLLEEKPVVVDFEAPWCTALILRHEELMKLDEEAKGEVKIFQVDVPNFR